MLWMGKLDFLEVADTDSSDYESRETVELLAICSLRMFRTYSFFIKQFHGRRSTFFKEIDIYIRTKVSQTHFLKLSAIEWL